jgi:hypothetical protein
MRKHGVTDPRSDDDNASLRRQVWAIFHPRADPAEPDRIACPEVARLGDDRFFPF